MAPTPSSKSNLITPSSKSHLLKTPNPKRLNFINAAGAPPPEHPVEVIGRIRNHPEKTKAPTNTVFSSLLVNSDGKSVRVKTENGYRDFSLDGVSSSEDDDIDGFYQKFVESRINGVKLGNKCTIMMYGPTGSGKSHTMFGCAKQPGIVYKSLKDILSDEVEQGNGERLGLGTFVQVTVLEIYNEEIYDLLSSGNTTVGGGGFSLGWPKGGGGPGSTSKVKLEVMGKKAKNATFISGNEAGKILKEIQKVEKRRIIKSTHCNERSSRSHCMIIVDVPTVGGQLMLVDMAGSENIEQAGQIGLEAKLQTAKINQGNIALKRVVESIANGDSHVPFRDSKLTMLLQDSFEDDKSKILMILCSSPDPKELHKTIATLEYGAKAKCIVRGPQTPTKEKGLEDSSSAVILGSRIAALDQFICKLQIENKLKEKERNEAQKELKKKEEEILVLRAKLAVTEGRGTKGISAKANEQTQKLEYELERKIIDCERRANEFIEIEKRKMEERFIQQQQEVDILRFRLHEIETQLSLSKGGSSPYLEGNSFLKRLRDSCCDDSDMVKSMDLDRSIDLETNVVIHGLTNNEGNKSPFLLTTVYEEEEEEDEQNLSDEEVQKEVIEEKRVIVTTPKQLDYYKDATNLELEDTVVSSRELRIKNIFTLCGDYREISHHDSTTTTPPVERDLKRLSVFTRLENDLKENHNLLDEMENDLKVNCNVLDENLLPLKTTPPVERELRRLSVFTKLENELKENDNLFDEKDTDLKENCNVFDDNLLPLKTAIQKQSLEPFSPLENIKISEIAPHLSSTPFITVRRH